VDVHNVLLELVKTDPIVRSLVKSLSDNQYPSSCAGAVSNNTAQVLVGSVSFLIDSTRGIMINYENGLQTLESFIKSEDSDDWRDFTLYKNRLAENLRKERRFGSTETLRSERSEIVDSLNPLALKLTGISFTDLAMGKLPPPSEGASASNTTTPSRDDFRYDAFISYSRKNRDWVLSRLLPRLEREGIRICIDERDFEIGAPVLENIENAVDQSRKTLLVLTPEWVESRWAAFESLLLQTDDPTGLTRRFLPLLVKPCELPRRLRVYTYLDLTDSTIFDAEMQRLLQAIRPSSTT
jgi:hypothetical protein